MKHIISHLFFIVALCSTLLAGPEGTKELNTNNAESTVLYLCNDFANHCNSVNGLRTQFATYDDDQSAAENDRLYFTIANASEAVYMGFKGGSLSPNPARRIVFRIKEKITGNVVLAEQNLPTSGSGFISNFTQAVNGPNQLIVAPNPLNGYDAMLFNPGPGTYYIEFTVRRNDNQNVYTGTFSIDLFDITVADMATTTAKPGRLHSKAWQLSEDDRFYGINYIISDDSIVTSASFTNMQGGAWVQYCNQTGCGTTNWINDRRSLYHLQALYPQYRIFLNNPDPTLFPYASTLGQIVNPAPWGERFCNTGHIIFHINVDKPGNVELTMTFSGGYTSRVMNQPVVAGENLFDWDGLDGTTPVGVPVPNNTNITFTIQYINGLTNLPLYDVEGNTSGFTISLVAPPGSTPAVYWDDTNIPGGSNNSVPPGCLSPPGCHTWSGTSGGWGNLNTVNTWWYNVSTTTTPAIIIQWRDPQQLVFQQSPPISFCENTNNHIFSVTPDANTDVYHWSYTPSTGVTIHQTTPGDSFITIDFGPGSQSGTLSVYGSNTNCGTSSPPSNLPVTIKPLPLPVITGPADVCAGSTGNVYVTQSGKTNYLWAVSPGGTVTAGGGLNNNSVTITWNTPGARNVSVNYSDNGCTASSPVVYPVTVNPLPVASIAGSNEECQESAGVIYSTDPGKLNYAWVISPGGTITAGGSSSDPTATVTWNATGMQMIGVNYTDPVTGCAGAGATMMNVTVKPLPVPGLNGPGAPCTGIAGQVYTTGPGHSGYTWTISPGGVVTAGGTTSDPSVTVTWNSPGLQSVSVNYTDATTGCTASSPTVFNVIVQPLPVPVIAGPASVCLNNPGPVYLTETGMNGYTWAIIPGSAGTITAGTGTQSVDVTWTATGTHAITVNYTDPVTGCTAAGATSFPVTVNTLPVPSIVGDAIACTNVPETYITETGASSYSWTASAGGTIVAGGLPGDHFVTVNWTTPGVQEVSVNYTIGTGCTGAAPTLFGLTVYDPTTPVITNNDNPICATHSTTYSTQAGMTDYSWTFPSDAIILSGGGSTDNIITIRWDTPGSKYVDVNFINAYGCTVTTPTRFDLVVNPLPQPSLTGPAQVCVSNPGQVYTTDPGMNSYTWSVIPASAGTITSGSGTNSLQITWLQTGTHTLSVNYHDGITGCTANSPTTYQVTVNPLPVVTLSGPTPICTTIPSTYTTQTGLSGYTWNISSGGSIVSGGTSGDPTVTVNWNTAGPQSVSVNYALATGCMALSPTLYPVTVNQSTPPVISSPVNPICESYSTTYSTQTGMTGYTWSVSPGGSITSPSTGNTITVLWNTPGAQYVDVNFTNGFGCTAPAATRYAVTVHPLPVSTISEGPGAVCQNAPHLYQTINTSGCTYAWTILPPAAGFISSGQGTHSITVDWALAGNFTIAVQATITATGCFTSSTYAAQVHPAPSPTFTPCFDLITTPTGKAFTLRGATPVLQGQGIFSGPRVNLNSTTGLYEFDPLGAAAGSYQVSYSYTNTYGCTAATTPVTIQVVNQTFSCGGLLTDVRDGKTYRTAQIGSRCWMKDNLNYGTILNPPSQPQTYNCSVEKYCLTGDATCSTHGGLYQWDELMDYGFTSTGQGICPPGWHIPTETEWQSMINAISAGVTPPADGIAGSFLKDNVLNPGFNAMFDGIYYLNNTWGFTSGTLTGAMFWTSTTASGERSIARGVNSIVPSVARYPGSKGNAFNVRCVRDL